MDQQNYGRVICSGGWFESNLTRTPKSNPILEYKPDFMPSVVDSPLFQPDGDEKVVDYLELLQIPPGTSTPDSQKIISGIEGNIKSTYVQNIQIVGAVSFSSCFLPLSLSIFSFFLFFLFIY